MNAAARADGVIAEALARFPRVALACSFGAPSGMALIDLVLRRAPATPVYYLDTGLLFPETLDLVSRARERWGIAPVAVAPELTLEDQAERYGEALWASDPDRCCALRKVAPQRAFLGGFDAWITGLRREDGATRRNVAPFAPDRDGLTKVAPLWDWTREELDDYVREHAIPVNEMHAHGFPSLGCLPCTRAVRPGEDPRAGRWPGFAKTECGLHVASAAAGD